MPGTLVHDSNQAKLLDATITTTTTGTIRDFGKAADIRLKLVIGTVSGTTPTLDVEVEASDSATFASGVVSLGRFGRKTTGNSTSYLSAYASKRYLRATATVGGTTPSFGSTVLEVEEPHYRRQVSDSA